MKETFSAIVRSDLRRYTNLTQPGSRLLLRNVYIDIIRRLLRTAEHLVTENDDLRVQLEAERERRRKLQEECHG